MLEVFPDSARIEAGHLQIAGCDAVDIASRFGTPVIVLDRSTIEERARAYAEALGSENVYYAGKAFCSVAMCQLLASEGLSLDVCTGGELATALAAGFPPERILFHGNNKSIRELKMADEANVGRIVADSYDEIERLDQLGISTKILIRVTPGVEAHTHEFVQTGQEDSKFGFGLQDDLAFRAVERALQLPNASVVGLHSHIGSQIFDMAAFDLAARRVAAFATRLKSQLGFECEELNLGGGLGIAHTHDEMTPDISSSVVQIVEAVRRGFSDQGLDAPIVAMEPGRALVGSAGVTIYEVGTVKNIPGVRTYVSVDGGMSDNIRPALYGARYEGFLANRMDADVGPRVTVCGKHCESGDILIKDVHLPADTRPGDLLVIPATGAYAYSMASNYNHVPRPPVVLLHEGHAVEIVARETYEDLLRLDRRLDGSAI